MTGSPYVREARDMHPALRPHRPEMVIAGLVGLTIVALTVLKLFDAIEFTTGVIIVISIRLIVPLMIFRYWLVGGIVAMLLDGADVILIDIIDLGGFGGSYAQTDKVLDSYYYVIELVVALRWRSAWMRLPAVGWFIFRVIGAAIFEFTNDHLVLFIFPNMFENWWLYCVVVMKWFPGAVPHDRRTVVIPTLALLVPKMVQEYILHFAELHPWGWLRDDVLPHVGIKL